MKRGVPTTFVTQLRVSLITDVDTFTSSLMFCVLFPFQSLSLIVETLIKLLKHLRPFGGIIVVCRISFACKLKETQIILISTEIVTSNDKQLQHKNQKQLEAKYCLDGKLQMKLS